MRPVRPDYCSARCEGRYQDVDGRLSPMGAAMPTRAVPIKARKNEARVCHRHDKERALISSAIVRYPRYAIYWAPDPADPLHAFGAAWLGHDPANPVVAPKRVRLGLPDEDCDRWTMEPRRYGLHATLKAPFRLAPGIAFDQLVERVDAIARSTQSFETPPLGLTALQGFLALCPDGRSRELESLAARCVTEIDPLRAQLDAKEIERRNPSALTPAQRTMLDTWGYPYVLSEFRFHITLTDRLEATERERVEPPLTAAVVPFCTAPFAVRSIALFGDPGGGAPFHLLQRFALMPA